MTERQRFPAGTNPNIADSDSDTLLDGWEVASGLDPNDDGTVDPANGGGLVAVKAAAHLDRDVARR